MNLKKLAKRVAREVKPNDDGIKELSLGREGFIEGVRGARRTTVKELNALQSGLQKSIPDDFDYLFCLGEGGIDAHLFYEDGMNAGGQTGFPCPLDDRLLSNLRKINWDECRGFFIRGASVQDEAADLAQTMGNTLPKTSQLQFEHGQAFDFFLKYLERENHKFAILAYDDSEASYEKLIHKTSDGMLNDLCNYCLLSRLAVVAVVSNRKVLSCSDTDALIAEELSGMGPISRAKALGNMQAAMQMIMS